MQRSTPSLTPPSIAPRWPRRSPSWDVGPTRSASTARRSSRRPADLDRRVWWFNLAEVARRQGDETTRNQAIEAAKGVDLSDEVTQRAANAHQFSRVTPARRPDDDCKLRDCKLQTQKRNLISLRNGVLDCRVAGSALGLS